MTTDQHARSTDPARPRVIVSVTATADGRVALNREERLLDAGARRRWQSVWPPDVEDLLAQRPASIERRHHPSAVLEGSGTFVADGDGPLDLPRDPAVAGDLRQDFLPVRSPRWFAVVDGRGRVAWTHKHDGDTRLLVVGGEDTPLAYLAYLRREAIPYLLAGSPRVDLAAALAKMRDRLGVTCVLSEAGGGLNGALLHAGLVDELHIITVPAVVGGSDTPSILDGPPLHRGSAPVRLHAVNVTVGSHGSVWAHYEVAGT